MTLRLTLTVVPSDWGIYENHPHDSNRPDDCHQTPLSLDKPDILNALST